MLSRRLLHHRMYRFGIMAVALAFVLQTVAVASMPAVSLSADGEMVVICTSTGMKTVPLAQFLGIESEQNQDQDQEAPGAMPSYGSCVLCMLAHNIIAIAPSLDLPCATGLNAHAPQLPPADAPVQSRVWSAKQARAPPTNA